MNSHALCSWFWRPHMLAWQPLPPHSLSLSLPAPTCTATTCTGPQVRLMLVLAPITCCLGAVAISDLLYACARSIKHKPLEEVRPAVGAEQVAAMGCQWRRACGL